MPNQTDQQQEPFLWLDRSAIPRDDSRIVQVALYSYMMKIHHGVILLWVFDQPDDQTEYALLIHLTNKESQAVFETNPTESLLEMVRCQLHDPQALLIVTEQDGFGWREIDIPTAGSESEFIDTLFTTAQIPPASYVSCEGGIFGSTNGLPEANVQPSARQIMEVYQEFTKAKLKAAHHGA